MNLLVLQARESLALPAEWEGYQFCCLPRPQDGQKDWVATHFSVIGGVAPLITRGKRKGRRNWRKMDKFTRREFVVSIADHLTWTLEWEKKNNLCYRCTGTGQTLASVTVVDGETYRPCSRCHGKKQHVQTLRLCRRRAMDARKHDRHFRAVGISRWFRARQP